ncbi:MAG: FIST N-terminal domain-containing protein [Synechococcaceae cyanobacterium]|nr:FIST N-terminal domain-containing protein [Synechococcaceae cyanobacterium]
MASSLPAESLGGLRERWIRVGSSTSLDPELAAAEALAPLLATGAPKLVLLFASPQQDLERLAALVAERIAPGALIGCSTAGELVQHHAQSGGLVLWGLGGEGFSVATGFGQGNRQGLRAAATEAAGCLERLQRRRHTVMVLLADGLCGDQMEVVRGAYAVAGVDVPLVGGCAGDDLAMRATRQIHGSRVLQQAVVAVAISSDHPLGLGVSHCWRQLGSPMLVTGSEGTSVFSLDDRPALDVYLETFAAPAEVQHDPEAFAAFASTRPLGIRRRDRIEIRFIAGADPERRSLLTIAEVPQGGLAFLMEGDEGSVLAATEQACRGALAALQGVPARGLLLFDCVARRGVLADPDGSGEGARIASVCGDIPVGGFYTYGEIARTKGAGGFHNQTLVALALA